MYKTKTFISDRELKAINLLKDNLKERYLVLYGVRLSEFLYPSSEYGSSEFFNDFESINSVTLPVIIYDSLSECMVSVVCFDDFSEEEILSLSGVKCIRLNGLSEILSNEELLRFYID